MKVNFNKIRPFIIPIIVTLCVVLLFHYIFMFGYVPTSSMEPTLEVGSMVLGLRLFDELETGDIRARRAAEAKLHDPVILEYWDSLTEERKKEFQDYLRNTKK